MPSAVWILLGLAGLVGGAELIVRHGATLAARLGVPSILFGLLTVTGMRISEARTLMMTTSLPRLYAGLAQAG